MTIWNDDEKWRDDKWFENHSKVNKYDTKYKISDTWIDNVIKRGLWLSYLHQTEVSLGHIQYNSCMAGVSNQ